jgi:predicted nucleic acid-binding protein
LDNYVFDASALLVWFGYQPTSAATKVEGLLRSASDGNARLLMSRINWGEVYNVIWRTRGQAEAGNVLRRLDALPVEVSDADADATKAAVGLVRNFGLHYSDSFACALALKHTATLVTADDHFKNVESVVTILWLT